MRLESGLLKKWGAIFPGPGELGLPEEHVVPLNWAKGVPRRELGSKEGLGILRGFIGLLKTLKGGH